jgi:lipopolysaccharide export system permease protein
MKLLDRYIARNFLYGYCIALFVLMGLFLTIDLFLNVDEFAELLTEHPELDLSVLDVVMDIVRFYSIRCALWYKDMAGMIIIIAAVFSLSRMTRNNELIAVMASGMSLKRILAPILVLSVLLTGLMILDQEFLIPEYAYELTRDHDDITYKNVYSIWFMGDEKGSLFCSQQYDETAGTLLEPFIILREQAEGADDVYTVVGTITAAAAVYDDQRQGWVLTEGRQMLLAQDELQSASRQLTEPVDFYPSSLAPEDIPIRKREGFKSLLSLRQLTELERHSGVRKTDMAQLALQKHSRFTDPIINLIMLMVALPVLVCRDPKAMKTAILISFVLTTSCFLVVFICKLFAAEVFLGRVRPALWVWAPIFIFFPLAVIEIDSMKT